MEYKAKLTEEGFWEIEKDSHQDTKLQDILNTESNIKEVMIIPNDIYLPTRVFKAVTRFEISENKLKVFIG